MKTKHWHQIDERHRGTAIKISWKQHPTKSAEGGTHQTCLFTLMPYQYASPWYSITRVLCITEYPLITCEQNNVSYPADFRYQINFANRDVADQFWRAIQKAVADKVSGWDTVARVTPQLFTHNPAVKNIRESVIDSKVAPYLFDKIFFQLLTSRDGVSSVGTIPTQAITDHINGRT